MLQMTERINTDDKRIDNVRRTTYDVQRTTDAETTSQLLWLQS